MKYINLSILTHITFCLLMVGMFTACEDETSFDDVNVTAVAQFYEPADERYTVLQSSGSLYFEWEPAHAEDNSVVYYDVLFDTPDGDFSNPLYTVTSDDSGLSAGATLTHKTLNKILSLMGVKPAAEGTLKWTVRSNRGLNFMVAETSRTLTMVRINSVDDLEGGVLYITGEGAEAGQAFKTVETGVYEIYTQLEANQGYHFACELGGETRNFVVLDGEGSFQESFDGAVDATVSETSVYRITLDFDAAAATLEKISELDLVVSYSLRTTELTYAGTGTWAITDYNVQLTETSWGFDERYKFVFTIDGEEEHWGQLGPHYDDRPSIDREGYRDMAPTDGGQWGGSQFKFPEELCDADDLDHYTADVTVYMTPDGNYTHEFTNIHE